MLENYLEDVENIPVEKIPELEEYKKMLQDVLSWKPNKIF